MGKEFYYTKLICVLLYINDNIITFSQTYIKLVSLFFSKGNTVICDYQTMFYRQAQKPITVDP